MTADLAKLKPSTMDPISVDRLRELPLNSPLIFMGDHHAAEPTGNVCRITGWGKTGNVLEYDVWAGPAGWIRQYPFARTEFIFFDERGSWRYPKLRALSFAMTTDPDPETGASRLREGKTVTRRRSAPWARPGALFNGWDRSFRVGKGKARYLGTFRVVSAETVGRWMCPGCGGKATKPWSLTRPERHRLCTARGCGWYDLRAKFDALTPAELAREGFPEMSADDFWAMLVRAGNVGEGGTCYRLEFQRA